MEPWIMLPSFVANLSYKTQNDFFSLSILRIPCLTSYKITLRWNPFWSGIPFFCNWNLYYYFVIWIIAGSNKSPNLSGMFLNDPESSLCIFWFVILGIDSTSWPNTEGPCLTRILGLGKNCVTWNSCQWDCTVVPY